MYVASVSTPELPSLLTSLAIPGFSSGLALGPTHEILIAARDGGLVVAKMQPPHRMYLPVVLKRS
ncbi:MAG: hypothetical protein FJ026_12865 [Chloroflexi bacterium]|nr:hypothetical protein [Chloroflexota bacterium]